MSALITRLATTYALLTAGAAAALHAQRVASASTYTVRLAENVYALIAPAGNDLMLASPDGALFVTARFLAPTSELKESIDALGAPPVRYVIQSGWSDNGHPSAAGWTAAGAAVVTHETVRDRMIAALAATKETQLPGLTGPTAATPVKGTLPAISFSEVIALEFGGEDTHAVAQGPGHSRGDASVHLHRSNVMYLGAIYVNGGYPEIDVAGGGSLDGLIAAVDRLLPNIGTRTLVVPGRGPVGNKVGLRAYREMLAAVRDRVKGQIKRGRSAEQVVAARPTAKFDAAWGKNGVAPNEFARAAYESMRKGGGAP